MRSKQCHLRYADFGTVPIISSLFDCLQMVWWLLGGRVVYYTHHKKTMRVLINRINKDANAIVCEDVRIAYDLRFFTVPITTALSDLKQWRVADEHTYQHVLWTLAYTNKLDKRDSRYLTTVYGANFEKFFSAQ